MRWGVMVCASIFFAIEGYNYLEAPVVNPPLVISHRGVSNGNGVQNTVESLEKTAQLKPDLIEMFFLGIEWYFVHHFHLIHHGVKSQAVD